MYPVLHNILITVFALIYVFGTVALLDFFVKKGLSPEISRKIIHIAAGSWLIFWLFYDATHWTKYLNVLPAFLWTLLLLYKVFFSKLDDKAVQTMTRTGDRRELLKGPLYFTIVMTIMGTVFYNSPVALTAMGFLGWGDGLAPVIGKKFGKIKYTIVTAKTLEGSFAFLFFGFFGAVGFHYLLIGSFKPFELLFCGIIAALAEAVSPKDIDNLIIPAAIIILYFFIL